MDTLERIAGDSSSSPKRITIQLSSDQYAHLDVLAKSQNITQSEALRKALATECYLRQALNRGSQILIKEGDLIKELVLL